MTVNELTEYLKTECAKCGTIEEYVNAFDRMAALPVNADYPIAHDEIMFQYGTYNWFMGKGREFEIGLSRTIPDGSDEYLNVNLRLFYEPDDWNASYKGAKYNELTMRIHAEFIADVRESEVYKSLIGREIKRIEVYQDGT